MRVKLAAHGVANRQLGICAAGILAAALLVQLHPPRVVAQEAQDAQGAPPPAWPNSPFHGTIDGATGQPIPCRCRFRGSQFRLGDTVCMNTHLGIQLARCDMVLNNTSWVPIGVPCTLSRLNDPRWMAN